MRLRDRLRYLSRAERHRRKIERELWSPLPPVRPDETGEFERIAAGIEAWKTGEFPQIETVISPEPIGPSLPTVDDRYALFAADPLTAELPGTPAKDNPSYADLLAEHAPVISPDLLARLEGPTGYWRADDFKKIGERRRP